MMKAVQRWITNFMVVLAIMLFFFFQPASAKPSWKFNKFSPSEIQSVFDIEEVLGVAFPHALDAISNTEQINAVLEVVRTCDRSKPVESCMREAIRKSVEAVKRNEVSWQRMKSEL
jgi:hypothetical protein